MKKSSLTKRDSYLRRVYGITEEQYTSLLKKQNFSCAVCGRPPKVGRNLSVDHRHENHKDHGGEVRGLLCNYCNLRIIGRHKKPDLLLAAAKYLSQGTGWFVPKKKKRKKKRVRSN